MTVFRFCNNYLPEFAAQFADDSSYGQLYWCIQGSLVEIHTAAHTNPIGRRLLSPSSILPPPPSHCAFESARKNSARSSETLLFQFRTFLKLLQT